MSSLGIRDIVESATLDQAALAKIAGGMDVKIDSVSSTVRSADDSSVLSPEVLGAIVNSIIDGLSRRRRPL